MQLASFMPIVFMVLLLALLVLQLVRGPKSPRIDGSKSTLALDGGQGGVGYLIPKSRRAEVVALRAAKRKP